jgi:signal transduction histidine kinase
MELNDYINSGPLSLSLLQVLERLPESYLILSVDKKILTATDVYLEVMGLSRSSVALSNLSLVLDLYNTSIPDLSCRVSRALDEVLMTGESRTIDAQYIRHRYYEIIQTPVLNEQRELLYIIHKLLDITRLIKKEFEFERRTKNDLKKLTEAAVLLSRVEEAGATGSYQLDLQSQDLSFSDGMYRLLGYEPGAFEPTTAFLKVISYPGDDEAVSGIISDAIRNHGTYEYTRRIYLPNKEMRYILSKGKVITDQAGEALSLLGVSHDITSQKKSSEALIKAHEKLQKSNALLQSIFDATLIGMSLLRPIRNAQNEIEDFTIVLVSKGLENETGRKDLVGKHYAAEFPGIKPAGLFDIMIKVMESGRPEQHEYFYPFEGFNRWFSCTFVKMDGSLVATNLDITAQREAEARIRDIQENQKLEVFKASLRTQEEERRRIAEDLRNGIGQLLYAVKINLKPVDANKALADPEAFHRAKQYADKILADAIKEVRRLSHQMTPAILEDFGLEETLIELCKQFQPDIDLSCRVVGLTTRLDSYIELSVYRMVQELLVNVVRHAAASEAIIEIIKEGRALTMLVQDNGIGFNPAQSGKFGLGLATLLNKVRMLNGTINIEAAAGTKVTINLPLEGV